MVLAVSKNPLMLSIYLPVTVLVSLVKTLFGGAWRANDRRGSRSSWALAAVPLRLRHKELQEMIDEADRDGDGEASAAV